MAARCITARVEKVKLKGCTRFINVRDKTFINRPDILIILGLVKAFPAADTTFPPRLNPMRCNLDLDAPCFSKIRINLANILPTFVVCSQAKKNNGSSARDFQSTTNMAEVGSCLF